MQTASMTVQHIINGRLSKLLIKNFGEKGAWAYPGTAQSFFRTPYYLRNG